MSPFSRFAHYFIAVARCGSLRRAAEQLHISASAINRQILQAEEAFGTPLFERLPEGLRMTTAGELLYDKPRCAGKRSFVRPGRNLMSCRG